MSFYIMPPQLVPVAKTHLLVLTGAAPVPDDVKEVNGLLFKSKKKYGYPIKHNTGFVIIGAKGVAPGDIISSTYPIGLLIIQPALSRLISWECQSYPTAVEIVPKAEKFNDRDLLYQTNRWEVNKVEMDDIQLDIKELPDFGSDVWWTAPESELLESDPALMRMWNMWLRFEEVQK